MFGNFDLDIDCQRFVRILNTALLVRRDTNMSPLTLDQVVNVTRRIRVAVDVLALRLQARAPVVRRGSSRGHPPRRLPRQTLVFLYLREQFQPLLQGIDERADPTRSADLDNFIDNTIAGWYNQATRIMLNN